MITEPFQAFNHPLNIFESLSESFTPYAVIVSDQQNRIVFWNRGAQGLFKYRAKEVLGKSFLSFDSQSPGETHTFESVVDTKFGEKVPVNVTISRCQSSDGTFEGHLYIIRDITEDKLRDTLRELLVEATCLFSKKASFSSMMQEMMDTLKMSAGFPLVYTCLSSDNQNFFVSSYSGTTKKVLELSCSIQGKSTNCMSKGCSDACKQSTVTVEDLSEHHIIQFIEQTDKEKLYIIHAPLLSEGDLTGILHFVVPESLKDFYMGESKVLSLIASKLSSEISFQRMNEELQVYADNLEKVVKKRTEQLREKDALLIQSGKLATLGEMATGIAHEINQPLGGISLIAQGLKKAMEKGVLTNEMMYVKLESINEQIDRINRIINHLRVFGRQAPEYKTPVDINKPVIDVFQLIGQQLANHGVIVEKTLNENLPKVMADSTKLEQVFLNIIGNARDALEDHELRVKELLASENPPEWTKSWEKRIDISTYVKDGKVVVSIKDTAGGIRHHILEKIFEPFFTTKEVGKGTGLGLSISYGIIKEFSGSIEVETELDHGSTFSVVLPAMEEGSEE